MSGNKKERRLSEEWISKEKDKVGNLGKKRRNKSQPSEQGKKNERMIM